MIRNIIRKELLVNLLSLRFVIGLLVTVSMMGLVGYVLIEDYAVRKQTYLSDVQRHKKEPEQTKVYSTIRATVDIPPSALSVFSRGIKDLPSWVHVSPYHVPSLIDEGASAESIDLEGSSNRPYNPLLRLFASIDLSFVISMILSLFAILLVFDSFSGEREQGTLKLVLSCSVGRIQLLIGKFLGALLTMAIPLTIGFLVVMLLWSLSAHVSLDVSSPEGFGASWIGTGLLYVFSLIFLAGFLALGLLVSLFSKESSASRLQRWKRLRDALIQPSLGVLYTNILTAIAGTDIESYDAALKRARLYREELMNYLRPKVVTPEWVTRILEHPEMEPTTENMQSWNKLTGERGWDALSKILNWDRVAPLDLSDMPAPRIGFSGLAERMERVMIDVFLLVLLTGCLLILSSWRVLHYNVQ